MKIDPREFEESLESQIRSIKPSIRLEYVTDDYEQYLPRGMHSVADSFMRFAHHESGGPSSIITLPPTVGSVDQSVFGVHDGLQF